MAHFIYEYSANIDRNLLDLSGLMEKMQRTAADTGIFPLSGMRSRAVCYEEYCVADGDSAKGFVNLSMRVGRGRDLDTRMECGELLFNTLAEHLKPLMEQQAIALSFEMRELDEHVKFNKKSF